MGAPPRVREAVRALRGAIEQHGWHGPSVLEAVASLTDEQGARLVPGAHHTIAELVDHVRHWEAVVLHHATRGAVPKPSTAEWMPPGPLSACVPRLRETHAALLDAVKGLGDDDLDRQVPVSGGTMRLVDVLHGLAAHGTYHGGQIRLLATLLDAGPR